MHLMLCLSTLSTLVFVALTQHLKQGTMRCENCIDSVDIDSIECIRDPLEILVLFVETVDTTVKTHPHIPAHNFLNIQRIFNPQKVLES